MGYSFFLIARFTSCLCAWQILPRWWHGDVSGVFATTGAAKRPTREDRRNIGNGWEWGELGYSYSGKIVDQKLRDPQQSTKDGGPYWDFTLKMGWHGCVSDFMFASSETTYSFFQAFRLVWGVFNMFCAFLVGYSSFSWVFSEFHLQNGRLLLVNFQWHGSFRRCTPLVNHSSLFWDTFWNFWTWVNLQL